MPRRTSIAMAATLCLAAPTFAVAERAPQTGHAAVNGVGNAGVFGYRSSRRSSTRPCRKPTDESA